MHRFVTKFIEVIQVIMKKTMLINEYNNLAIKKLMEPSNNFQFHLIN